MKKILVIGSISIDNVTYTSVIPGPGDTVYGESFLSNIGGKGANQACAAKQLGADVTFYGSIGDDNNGKTVQNSIKNLALDAHFKMSKHSTGIASITIDNTTAENRIIIVQGANLDIQREDIDAIDFSKYDILLLQLENDIKNTVYAMKKGKENGLIVVLNPAPYHELPKECYKCIDFFIPNEHELEQYTKDVRGDFLDKAKSLIHQGIRNIIVTLGDKGSLYVDPYHHEEIEAYKVNAVDTTAAGDCYCGAFVTALAECKSPIEAMKFASKASSIAVTRKGAISSLPTRDEVK